MLIEETSWHVSEFLADLLQSQMQLEHVGVCCVQFLLQKAYADVCHNSGKMELKIDA